MENLLGVQNLSLFVISGLLLNMIPGPDSVLIMTRSARQGWRAGSVASFGISSGTLIHIVAAALGVSAILATSATAFMVLKYIGALYLIYIGIKQVLSKTVTASEGAAPLPCAYGEIFKQGFWSNVLNPKVALFFMAFVPQFIAPNASNTALSFLVLGAIFNVNSLLWCHFLAALSASAGQRIRLSDRLKTGLNRSIGLLFVGFGLKLALSEKN